MNIGIVIAVVLFASISNATKSVGNGGVGVVCDQKQDKTIDLLDIFEAQQLDKSWALSLGENNTLEAKINLVISRIAKFSPQRARNYETVFADLLAHVRKSSQGLYDLGDSGIIRVQLPMNCTLHQLGIQIPAPVNPYSKILLVNQKLYDNISDDQKAAFIVHEVVTAEAAQWGLKNSYQIRPLVAMLVSNKFDETTLEDFITAFQAAGIYSFEANGRSLYFHSVSGVLSPPSFTGGRVVAAEIGIQTPLFDYFKELGGNVFATGRVLFADDGSLSEFVVSDQTDVLFGHRRLVVESGDRIFLDKSHHIIKVINFRNGKRTVLTP